MKECSCHEDHKKRINARRFSDFSQIIDYKAAKGPQVTSFHQVP